MAVSQSSSTKIGSMAAIGEGVRSESPSSGHPALPSPTPAAELLPLEVKRCDIKTPEKKYPTQLRISVGGRAPRKIAERNPIIIISDDEEPEIEARQVIVLPRRSSRLLGVKRKDYNEKTPEPKDYGGDSDWEDDRSAASWGATGRYNDDDDFAWGEYHRRQEEEERQERQENQVQDDDGGYPNNQEHGHGCCPLCRERIDELFIGLNACRKSIDRINREVDNMEWQADEDYKFLHRNVRKLFGMVGNARRNQQGSSKCGCKSCRGK